MSKGLDGEPGGCGDDTSWVAPKVFIVGRSADSAGAYAYFQSEIRTGTVYVGPSGPFI